MSGIAWKTLNKGAPFKTVWCGGRTVLALAREQRGGVKQASRIYVQVRSLEWIKLQEEKVPIRARKYV